LPNSFATQSRIAAFAVFLGTAQWAAATEPALSLDLGNGVGPALPLPNVPSQSFAEGIASASLFGPVSIGPCFCLGLAVTAVVFIVVLLRLGQRIGAGGGPAFRIADDGFWLPPTRYVPGTTIRYRCRVGPHLRTSHFTVGRGPRGQFIYTGERPEDIEILGVMPSAQPAVDTWDDDDSTPATSSGGSGDFDDKPASSAGGDFDDKPASSSAGGDFDDKSDSGSAGGDFPSAY
jgi:hypothetical protein